MLNKKVYMVILKKQKVENIYTEDTIEEWAQEGDYIVPDDYKQEYSPTINTIAHQQYLFNTKEKAIGFLDEQKYLYGNGGTYIDIKTYADLKNGFTGDNKYDDGRWEGFWKEMEIK